MGDVLVKPGGGGGVDCDTATAVPGDILAGRTAGTAGSDDLVTGTMPNRGAWNGSAGMNSSVAIPQGYHSGGGRVTGPSVPVQNAEVDGDRVNATAVSCASGQINLGVRNGYYLKGVNWVKGSFPTLTAANIKKGINIGGIVGTWEGYVSPIVFVNSTGLTSYSANGVTPMLYNGKPNNKSGISTMNGYVQMSISPYNSIYNKLNWSGGVFNNAVVVSEYNYVSVTFNFWGYIYAPCYLSVGLNTNPRAFSQDGPNSTIEVPRGGTAKEVTLTFNISNISGWQYLLLYSAGTHTSNTAYPVQIVEICFYK